MSAGSGDGRRFIWPIHGIPCAGGATRATVVEPATLGREQQVQKWQFGAHSPPERSPGQLSSSHGASPQSSRQPAHVKGEQGQQDDEDGAPHGPSIARAEPDR